MLKAILSASIFYSICLGSLYTLYKKPPDLGLCLELCQHCACLFHVHVFVQVRSIQEVEYFCKNFQIITCKVSFNQLSCQIQRGMYGAS